MDTEQSRIERETLMSKTAKAVSRASKNLSVIGKTVSEAVSNFSELKKQANLSQGLSAKGKTRNPNYRTSRELIASKKTNRKVKAFHKLHGQLNRAIRVNVPTKDRHGFTQKLEKVKIALQKGLIKTA